MILNEKVVYDLIMEQNVAYDQAVELKPNAAYNLSPAEENIFELPKPKALDLGEDYEDTTAINKKTLPLLES